jgi:hypothetical protein
MAWIGTYVYISFHPKDPQRKTIGGRGGSSLCSLPNTDNGHGNIIKNDPQRVLWFLLAQTRHYPPLKPTLYTCKPSTTLPTFTMKKEAACTSKTVAALLTYTQCRDPTAASTLKANYHRSLKLVTSRFDTEIHTWPAVRPSSRADWCNRLILPENKTGP